MGSSAEWGRVRRDDVGGGQGGASQCAHGPPCVAVLIGRWGTATTGWPATMHLLLRSLSTNRRIDFYLLSEQPPSGRLPANVHFRNWTLDALYARLSQTVGLRLPNGSADLRSDSRTSAGPGFLAGRDISGSKVNDLKPMWGDAFGADLLAGYDWWGYMQDDVLLGDMSADWAMASRAALAAADVITPYPAPFNSSGVFMLFRNAPQIRSLWRRSADAAAVLRDPRYLVFDEWWGLSKDNMAVVLSRESGAGRVRLKQGGVGWYGQDYNNPPSLMVCWWRGRVFTSLRWGTSRGYPCADGDRRLGSSEWGVYHFARLKKERSLSKLSFTRAQQRAVERASEFQMGIDGVLLPDRRGMTWLLPSQPPLTANVTQVQNYLARVDVCDDVVEHPRVAFALGLPEGDGRGWCWRQRFRRRGHCKTSLAVQVLCLKGCGLCPTTRYGGRETLAEEVRLALQLREVAEEDIPPPSLRTRLGRAWRTLVGSARSRGEAADLIDDWEWWHARGRHYPRGRLHARVQALIARSPLFTELSGL